VRQHLPIAVKGGGATALPPKRTDPLAIYGII
jgi:hypothetical protein